MGAMLADDMGLGKTLQALCALQGRTLIVCPTSVLQAWLTQLEQFRPDLSVSLYYGSGRKLDPRSAVVLTTYSVLRLDLDELNRAQWETIVLDEAQVIKNPESQAARAAHALRGKFRIALSGTPVENRLDDLWSQFQFLNPGLLGSRQDFQEEYAGPVSRGDQTRAAELRARVRPFILRRLKKEVAPELPPRTETVLQCELSQEERDTYDAILASARSEVLEKLEAGANMFAALEILLRLRQACCDSRLLPGAQSSSRSSKVELLMETLEESLENGHRALIFSQWTSFLDLLEPELKASGIRFSRLDGTTVDRAKVVEDFQRPDGPSVLLLSLKAGGVGLTLTAADHVFLLDPWWNPAAEDQAADRAHRIGQKNPVLIHKLVARDTVEDRILLLQQKKLQLAGAVMSDAGAAASMTRDDLIALLS
jgi:SNF2 family DNA or RNA helicase